MTYLDPAAPAEHAFAARRNGPLKVSFEFFPPKTAEMEESLWRSVLRLAPLQPRFVSVTYGAGGSTRERTHATVARIARETGLSPAAHLTCVGASKAEVDDVARQYLAAGINHIVALRGDPPEGSKGFAAHAQGYANSTELVAGLKRIADFEISVGCYPEGHPDSTSPRQELEHLKRKVDAGATRAISQYFFDPDTFLRFLDRARSAGITVPIVPGILPVTNFRQVVRFSAACGASVPVWLADMFDGLDEDAETRRMVAAHVAAEQCRRLQAAGIDEFHFYTLNRADLTYAICHVLGVRPAPGVAAQAGS
ncbi:methylenetetrahydrofolate reductase [NAD(P)H] [Ferrovibrio sp.]|uniref:methylenetetrahydrofolate reductase [NAD(P)H] n=1 Tax=Ferrovibrio sp. TaxID=1917215 RepID=UPI0025B9AE2B|nr:methylenetetrahydrofolate reductase [NAD(P)H] [Ferrovibrio sp.]MBX3455037.1 methylenetetrahydrofolate reductase [NAD(P)H] [Ferrovibrio sp.]